MTSVTDLQVIFCMRSTSATSSKQSCALVARMTCICGGSLSSHRVQRSCSGMVGPVSVLKWRRNWEGFLSPRVPRVARPLFL